MKLFEALKAASTGTYTETRVFRQDGPSLIVDELGQIKVERDCLYLGDALDLDDWQIAEAYDPLEDFNYVGSRHHY